MKSIRADANSRFAALRRSIEHVREMIAARGYAEAPDGQEKAEFVAALRSVLSDEAVAWLDAVAAVDDDDARFMPLLGSGGNEGVLDYSGLFLRSLVETLLTDPERSARLLSATLDGAQTTDLLERPGGQFDPGTAGGFNTGPGLESKDLPNNPWTFVLLIEGSAVWASAIASRQQGMESNYRFAVSPFTVRHRAAGYGSAGSKDDDPQRVRAEVWLPIWRRAATLAEIQRFIAEGRVDVRGPRGAAQRATDSLDFADAVASLGVDRGVDSFARYALMKRRGDSFIAVPVGRHRVEHRREVDLLRELDRELSLLDGFLRLFPGDGPPAALVSRRRAIDEARFDVARRGGPDAMRMLVRALGTMEMFLARRDPGKKPKLPRPLGGLSAKWIDACGDGAEVELAAAITSIVGVAGAGPLREYLAPIEGSGYAAAQRTLAWAGSDLADRMGSVLQRRLLDARARSADTSVQGASPMWGARAASSSAMSLFLHELVDERALEELLFGFTWVKAEPGVRFTAPHDAPPLHRAYALLRLIFSPGGIRKGDERLRVVPDAALVPLLRAGRVSEAIDLARRQLRARGFVPRRVIDQGVHDAALGRRLAAALLIPVAGTRRLAADALVPSFDETEHIETEEITDDR